MLFTQNYSPHLTHPGWHLLNTHTHAHAQGHTLMETDAIHSGGQPITAPREHEGKPIYF